MRNHQFFEKGERNAVRYQAWGYPVFHSVWLVDRTSGFHLCCQSHRRPKDVTASRTRRQCPVWRKQRGAFPRERVQEKGPGCDASRTRVPHLQDQEVFVPTVDELERNSLVPEPGDQIVVVEHHDTGTIMSLPVMRGSHFVGSIKIPDGMILKPHDGLITFITEFLASHGRQGLVQEHYGIIIRVS